MNRMLPLPLDLGLLRAGERVCCAVSGGADSVALLLALQDANAAKLPLGVVLSVVHVHHGLRGQEADEEESFVRELCRQRAIPCHVAAVDTDARRGQAHEGLEEAARQLRYGIFRQLLVTRQADVIATGHTLDDQAETVLMKLVRGAWTEGLAGIAPVLPLAMDTAGRLPGGGGTGVGPGRVVRPLLETTRAQVEGFLRARGQVWRDDSSNLDTTLTRNRIRRQVLPELRTMNPAVNRALAATARIAREEEAFWRGEVERLLPGLLLPGKPVRGGGRAVSTAVGEGAVALEVMRLRPFAPALQRRLLRAAAETLGCRLNAEETAKLMALAGLQELPGLTARNGTRLELSQGLRAERSARELRLFKAPKQ